MADDQRDFLTQLLNREAFDRQLDVAVEEARHLNEPLGVVMADVDHFKCVNDEHGHQTGDAVLKAVAACVAAGSRAKGAAFRYGGEELTVVLPNHSLQEATAVAERIRLQVEGMSTDGVRVTASFGVACFPLHGQEARAVVRASDQALYDAKNRGRNLVRVYGEPEPIRVGPREVERKVAKPGRLTADQKAELRRRLLRDERIECPADGAYLKVVDVTHAESVGREFIVICPDCGMSDTLSKEAR